MSAILQGLTNIRKREIHLIAARLMNIIRALPRNPSPRKITSEIDGTVVTQDVSGEAFDTLWNENSASQVCVFERKYSLLESKLILNTFYDVAKAYSGGTTVPSLTTVNSLYDNSTTTWRYKRSYAELGYTIDQTTLDNDTRDFDFYELLKMLCDLDLIACWYVVYGRSGTTKLLGAVNGVLDIVCELARISDGLTPLDFAFDKYEFVPTAEQKWKDATVTGTAYNTANYRIATVSIKCTGRKTGLTQVAVRIDKPYRLTSLTNVSNDIEFSQVRETSSYVWYISDEFYPTGTEATATVKLGLQSTSAPSATYIPKAGIIASFK